MFELLFGRSPENRCEISEYLQITKKILSVHTNFSRIKLLQEWIVAEPHDNFSRYALALEYGKANEVGKMRQEFEYLLANAPDYLPTYYHVGSLYEELGEIALAKTTFQKGIALAEAQQDAHALRELKAVYHNLLMEYDLEDEL